MLTIWTSKLAAPRSGDSKKYPDVEHDDAAFMKRHRRDWKKFLAAGCPDSPIDTVELRNLLGKIPGLAPFHFVVDSWSPHLIRLRFNVTEMGWEELQEILRMYRERLPERYSIKVDRSAKGFQTEITRVLIELNANEAPWEIPFKKRRLLPIGHFLFAIEEYLAIGDE